MGSSINAPDRVIHQKCDPSTHCLLRLHTRSPWVGRTDGTITHSRQVLITLDCTVNLCMVNCIHDGPEKWTQCFWCSVALWQHIELETAFLSAGYIRQGPRSHGVGWPPPHFSLPSTAFDIRPNAQLPTGLPTFHSPFNKSVRTNSSGSRVDLLLLQP